jgi:ribosome maturation factor RimP
MLKDQIKNLVEEKIAGTDCFLVDVKIAPSKIMIFIDRPSGIRITDCVGVHRFLMEQLEETDITEHYELEVSSPGMDEPLKVLPQYQKRIGREVNVVTFDGLKHTGILRNASELFIELEEIKVKKMDGKKIKVSELVALSFAQIKETKVTVSFDKLLK